MKYKRKTVDIWRLFVDYGEGRESVNNYTPEQLAEILEKQGYGI